MPKPEAAAMPPIVALNGPHPSAATISGSGAMMESSNETGTPDIVEANISADAQPAARAMRTIAIISCPAPFERLDRGQFVSVGFSDTSGVSVLPGVINRLRNAAVANSIGNDDGPAWGPCARVF